MNKINIKIKALEIKVGKFQDYGEKYKNVESVL